jgi:glutathione synthase/RimK-type ligase-like ATP-grasp enzyme
MEIMGVKDSLVKISNLSFGRKDTYAYYNIEEWNNNFLSDFRKTNYMNRVIKQNNGSQGEGIWVIEIKDKLHKSIHLDSLLIIQEAKDNIKQELTIKKFMKMCEQYFLPKNGLIVNQAFLPSITKGEIRLLLIGNKIVSIIEKVPIKGGISATLNSGARYTEYNVDTPKFKNLVDNFSNEIKNIQKALEIEEYPLPLIWTADFIEDIERSSYCLGEFNCTCVGIKTVLEKVVPLVANNIDKIIRNFS